MNQALVALEAIGYFKAAQAKPPQMLLAQAEAMRWDMPDATQAEKQARLYAMVTWISTAIDHTAALGAGGVVSVKQLIGGPDGDEKDLPNHDFELLLRRPNPLQSGFEFKRDLLSWTKLTGNGYIFQNAVAEGAAPDELWLVPSQLMVPIPDGQSYIKGYKFMLPNGGEPIFVDRWRIIHLKTFNPNNPFVGLSAVQSLALDAYGDLAQQKWNVELFDKNAGKFPGILAFKQMIADPEWKKMIAQRDNEWGGTNRASVMMLRGVGDAIQWLPAAITQKEMEFLESRTFTKQEIYDKLAPGLSSILAVNATEANAIAGKATLIELGVWPLLDQLGQKFTSEVMPLYGEELVCEFDDMRQTNRILDMQEQEAYERTHTVNEVRREYYGDEPLYLDKTQANAIAEEDKQAEERKQQALTMLNQPAAPPPAKADTSEQPTKDLDPRGLMFVAQIGPATPLPGEKKPAPPPMLPAQPPALQQEGDTLPDDQDSTQAAQAELAKWEKFEKARFGKGGRAFVPRVLPLFQAARIQAALARATTWEAKQQVFAGERFSGASEIERLAAAIEAATEKLE